jgi:hypothetical protein
LYWNLAYAFCFLLLLLFVPFEEVMASHCVNVSLALFITSFKK